MCPGPTFDRVYVALKSQLMEGRFAPGDHLEPVLIGEELHSSITPVRDALHRLVGERMVEAPRHDGFRVPFPTEAELRDLYGWNRELAELAVRRAGGAAGDGGAPPADAVIAERAAIMFQLIARRAGSAELEEAMEGVGNRLSALRHIEARLFADAREEIDLLLRLLDADETAGLRRALAAYHRRRQRAVPELLVLARPRERG
jgi:DNA-binding GntR family transcriptional regulator